MLTSFLFAAVHLPQWPAPLAIFLLSLGLGVVYQRTGSLVASVVMHGLFNSLATLVLLGGMLEKELPRPEKKNPAVPAAKPNRDAARTPR
jgi:membrane protease YdiL (CAAX protease family)